MELRAPMSRAGADAVKHTVRRTREQQVRVSESRGKVGGQLVASVKARNAHSRVHVLNSVARQWEPLKVHEQESELGPAAAVPSSLRVERPSASL